MTGNNENMISCQACGETHKDWLGQHLLDAHGMSVADYTTAHPGAQVASPRLGVLFDEETKGARRALPPTPKNLTVEIGGFKFPVNAGVPADACLPLPPEYRIPEYGELANDVKSVLIALLRKRSTYVWGLPGTGKDAVFHAFSAWTRTPAIIKQVIPGTDIESWFFSRGFNDNGTFWEEGDVLKALRDGYTCADGTKVPYLLLVSDFDRADRSQTEYLRLITDSIQGRVSGPTGTVYNLMPGTLVMATANTPGGGDERGRMVSANPIDASILDRFDRKYQFHSMDWRDEEPVARAKFPVLASEYPKVFTSMGLATRAIRSAIDNDELYAEFSHRALCSILSTAEDLLYVTGKKPSLRNLMVEASRAWWDGLPDRDTRQKAQALMDPHFKGGVLHEGDTSHIGSDPLADF